MTYSEKESAAKKQVAISAVSYFVSQGANHVTLSLTSITARMTVFCETFEEAQEYEQQSSIFMLDGTLRQIRELPITDDEIIYTLELDWLP